MARLSAEVGPVQIRKRNRPQIPCRKNLETRRITVQQVRTKNCTVMKTYTL